MLLDLDDDARRILTLLCCAFEPLSVAGVLDAAAVQLGDHPRFDVNEWLFGGDELLRICPGLIEITDSKVYGMVSNIAEDDLFRARVP